MSEEKNHTCFSIMPICSTKLQELTMYIVFCGILVLLAIDPNSKDLVWPLDLPNEASLFFQLDCIYFEIPMLVENGADGRWRSFELCHNIFLSNFSYSIRTYFLRSVSAGEWWWCLKNKLGIKQVFFKVLLYVCMYILIVSHFGVHLWLFLVHF